MDSKGRKKRATEPPQDLYADQCIKRDEILVAGCMDAHTERVRQLESYIRGLEEERLKIEGFKRELPLCLHLLHEAIESSKEQLADCSSPSRRWSVRTPSDEESSALERSRRAFVLEEFIPVRKPSPLPLRCIEEPETKTCASEIGYKPHPIKAAHIWNPEQEFAWHSHERCQSSISAEKASPQPEQAFSSSSIPFFHSKQKSGGAFTPFSRDKHVVQVTCKPSSTEFTRSSEDGEKSPRSHCENTDSVHTSANNNLKTQPKASVMPDYEAAGDGPNASQPTRKARRCWSAELHRRFLDALEQLGGSQVAKPKQIRELMRVEGLTNDEVKSHLQKYRLHTKRPTASQNMPPQVPQVVVLGGLWVPPDYPPTQEAVEAAYSSSKQAFTCQRAMAQAIHPVVPLASHSSEYLTQQCRPTLSRNSTQNIQQILSLRSGDPGQEESVCEDDKSQSFCLKEQNLGIRLYNSDQTEDWQTLGGSVNGSQSVGSSHEEVNIG